MDTHTNMPVSVSACVKPAECEEATFQEAKALNCEEMGLIKIHMNMHETLVRFQ